MEFIISKNSSAGVMWILKHLAKPDSIVWELIAPVPIIFYNFKSPFGNIAVDLLRAPGRQN